MSDESPLPPNVSRFPITADMKMRGMRVNWERDGAQKNFMVVTMRLPFDDKQPLPYAARGRSAYDTIVAFCRSFVALHDAREGES
ncbi:MAG: hypothetical protein IH885_04465 [Myxococcales bacterium]|nr:hypothetical protein [Myxococcales bacterium]